MPRLLRDAGKPKLLGGNLSGWWLRRINPEHRLVYRVAGKVRRTRLGWRNAGAIFETQRPRSLALGAIVKPNGLRAQRSLVERPTLGIYSSPATN